MSKYCRCILIIEHSCIKEENGSVILRTSVVFLQAGLLSFTSLPYCSRFYSFRDQPWFSVFKHSLDHEEGV